MEAGESSVAVAAVVAARLGSDSALCVAGAPNARHSCSAPRFYSLPTVPFLALLLELHIIEVFVLCGRLCCAASTLGECSVAAECGTTWISLVLPPWLHSRPSLIHCLSCVGAFFFCLKGLVEGYDFACETFLFGIEWGKSVSDGLMCHESWIHEV